MPLYSIVTVCFNPPIDGLNGTIRSVLNNIASLGDVRSEYIIVDGGSTNGAVNIINEIFVRSQLLGIKNLEVKVIIEPDKGIYDAMNKGIAKSNGRWVIFMNSGDQFSNNNTLERIRYKLDDKKSIVYGDMINRGSLVKAHPRKYLKRGIIMACHQSMFFNRPLLKGLLKYNVNYTIYADYELVVRICNRLKDSIIYLNEPISIYEGGGISDQISTKKRNDKYRILYEYYGVLGVFRGLLHWTIERIYKLLNIKNAP
ncbi:glycosyltransferase [Aeromonas veronii]|uniref:glycosyltransferase n=1 Tax=Aeromonas veronii TaxID=654 RepID=UPI003D19C493